MSSKIEFFGKKGENFIYTRKSDKTEIEIESGWLIVKEDGLWSAGFNASDIIHWRAVKDD